MAGRIPDPAGPLLGEGPAFTVPPSGGERNFQNRRCPVRESSERFGNGPFGGVSQVEDEVFMLRCGSSIRPAPWRGQVNIGCPFSSWIGCSRLPVEYAPKLHLCESALFVGLHGFNDGAGPFDPIHVDGPGVQERIVPIEP